MSLKGARSKFPERKLWEVLLQNASSSRQLQHEPLTTLLGLLRVSLGPLPSAPIPNPQVGKEQAPTEVSLPLAPQTIITHPRPHPRGSTQQVVVGTPGCRRNAGHATTLTPKGLPGTISRTQVVTAKEESGGKVGGLSHSWLGSWFGQTLSPPTPDCEP